MLMATLIIVISLVFLGVIWFLQKSGLFKPILINITEPPFNQLTIMYKYHHGDYSKSGVFFKNICTYSQSHFKLGIYYDDPKIIPVEKRRYAVGAVVDEIKDQKLIEQMKKDNYQIFKLPKFNRSIYTTFPLINNLSIFIAVMQVPYRLGEYIQTNKFEAHPFIEIYERSLIHYLIPLNNFENYNIPEITNK